MQLSAVVGTPVGGRQPKAEPLDGQLPDGQIPDGKQADGQAPDDQLLDELAAAVFGLLQTWKCLGRRGGEHNRSGLSAREMAALIGEGEHRLSELAELRNVDQSVISRQIGDLEVQGLVTRRPDPADRRASLVRLTPDGLRLLAHARELRRDWLRRALSDSPAADLRAGVELVTALTTELGRHLGEPTPDPELIPRTRSTGRHVRTP